MAERLPGLTTTILDTTTCRYTMTADSHFVIDTLPQAPEIVIASPCSGHGFKFGMLIGAILAELATTSTTRYPIDHLRAQRLLGPPSRPGGDG